MINRRITILGPEGTNVYVIFQYLIVTVVEEGGSGSAVAAPVSRRIIQYLLEESLTPVEFGEITEWLIEELQF